MVSVQMSPFIVQKNKTIVELFRLQDMFSSISYLRDFNLYGKMQINPDQCEIWRNACWGHGVTWKLVSILRVKDSLMYLSEVEMISDVSGAHPVEDELSTVNTEWDYLDKTAYYPFLYLYIKSCHFSNRRNTKEF